MSNSHDVAARLDRAGDNNLELRSDSIETEKAPVFQRRQRLSRDVAAWWMPRLKRGMTVENSTRAQSSRRATRPRLEEFIRPKK
jgi:hypothetical protein